MENSHAEAPATGIRLNMITLTNVLQVQKMTRSVQNSSCSVCLDGIVLWVDPERDQFMLQDDSGGLVIKMDLHEVPAVRAGQAVHIGGSCLMAQGVLVSSELINNDGVHSAEEKSGTLFLSAGWHPIVVDWFNGPRDMELAVDWMGPGMTRQRMSSSVLFRAGKNDAIDGSWLLPGLEYQDFEGAFDRVPDYSKLPMMKQGVATDFDLGVRSRDTNVALLFSGYFSAPQSGSYQFWLKSDDGSRLYIGDRRLKISVLGEANWPAPRLISPAQFVSEEQDCRWSEVEGTITQIREMRDSVFMELASGTGRIYLKIMGGKFSSLLPLLHSSIKAAGIYQNTKAIDGQSVPGLLVPDMIENIAILKMASRQWLDVRVTKLNDLTAPSIPATTNALIHVRGIVRSNSLDGAVIDDGTGQLRLDRPVEPIEIGGQIDALGWLVYQRNQVVLRGAFFQSALLKSAEGVDNLPMLTKAIEVKSLSRKEAQRGCPVKIQGVITARAGTDFVIQDSTWSVFCLWSNPRPDNVPAVGEFWEIEGKSGVDFAPMVVVQRAAFMCPGILPEPLRPTRDELINGSLDTQYIEVQGIATGVKSNAVELLTREGKIKVEFLNPEPNVLTGLENALVRVRGIGWPNRDTNQMILPTQSSLRLFNAAISVDDPPPAHPFATPLRRALDLLFFDTHADALRRVKVAGQVLSERNGQFFLMDGINGLRFELQMATELHVGDLVEVVGFPDMSGPAPLLRESVVQRTGHASLPMAIALQKNSLLNGGFDSLLVSIECRLIGSKVTEHEQILEVEAGTRNFIARLPANQGGALEILPGSRLNLTGVYIGLGGDRAASRDIGAFELLLNSPLDVQVLARPSWWTFRHTVAVMTGLGLTVLVAFGWITLLRRQVAERTHRLALEIKHREKAEYQQTLEAERTRIARDLHDDLGATLTEIGFLSAVKVDDSLASEITRSQLKEVSEKSRQMVSSLDEIVWAVNPANDSLPNLANYFCHLAEDFFRASKVRCRLDVDEVLPSVPLTSEVRHNLYLIIREAFNNTAKHSQATEVWLRVLWKDQGLHIVVEDNGRGFDTAGLVTSGNGLINMRQRLEKLGGQIEYKTSPGAGMICHIHLPLQEN